MSKKWDDGIPGLAKVSEDVVYPHVFANSDREVGGVLVGRHPSVGGGVPLVTGAIEALKADEQRATLTFTQDAWEHVHRTLDTEYGDGEQIVGWYHSHPGFGIFLSGHDLFIHRNFFSGPTQIALVVDPLEGTEGVFVWRGDQIVPLFDRPTPGREGLGAPEAPWAVAPEPEPPAVAPQPPGAQEPQGSVAPPPAAGAAEHVDETVPAGPARYRVATEARRAPYPRLLLAGTGVLGVLVGLLVWTLAFGGSDPVPAQPTVGTPASQSQGGASNDTQGGKTAGAGSGKVTPTTPASGKQQKKSTTPTTTTTTTTTTQPAVVESDPLQDNPASKTSTCKANDQGLYTDC